jgi:DNA-binding IclR family transcriptional regulator
MKTLARFFSIVDLLEEMHEARLKEIAERLGLDRSTVYRFLSTGQKHGYIQKDDKTSRYSLGYRFLVLSATISKRLDIRKIAHQHLVELEQHTGETIHLTIFDGKNVVYIDKIERERPVRMYSRIGNIAPMHCTAVGKAILAYQPDGEIEKILDLDNLKKYTPNTITDKGALLRELKKIRETGYAVDRQEHEDEICCIASPIWNSSGSVHLAISISAIISRTKMKDLLTFVPVLKQKSMLISRSLGFVYTEGDRRLGSV